MARRKRKNTFKPDFFSSCASDGHDSFAMIFNSTLKSHQFQALSNSVKLMYVYCRNQLTSTDGRRTLYKHAQEDGATYDEFCFVFPAKHMAAYGLDRSNGLRALQTLINAGFISKVEGNAHRKKINVYRFSAAWKKS